MLTQLRHGSSGHCCYLGTRNLRLQSPFHTSSDPFPRTRSRGTGTPPGLVPALTPQREAEEWGAAITRDFSLSLHPCEAKLFKAAAQLSLLSFQLLKIPRAIKRDLSRKQNQYREGTFWA